MDSEAPESSRPQTPSAESDLELTRHRVEECGASCLIINELEPKDMQHLGWMGSQSRWPSLASYISLVPLGDAECLAVRSLGGIPIATGAIDYLAIPDAATIVQLITHERLRGLGIGTALIAAAEERVRKRGLRIVKLGVADDNLRAKALYERLGYTAVARLPGYWLAQTEDGGYKQYETVVTQMKKMLSV